MHDSGPARTDGKTAKETSAVLCSASVLGPVRTAVVRGAADLGTERASDGTLIACITALVLLRSVGRTVGLTVPYRTKLH